MNTKTNIEIINKDNKDIVLYSITYNNKLIANVKLHESVRFTPVKGFNEINNLFFYYKNINRAINKEQDYFIFKNGYNFTDPNDVFFIKFTLYFKLLFYYYNNVFRTYKIKLKNIIADKYITFKSKYCKNKITKSLDEFYYN